MKTENTQRSAQSEGRLYGGKKLLAAYVDPDEAKKFKLSAKVRNLSAAKLLELAILRINKSTNDAPTENEQDFSESKGKRHGFTAHLTTGEAQRLREEAKRHEMRPSPFIRMILRGALTKSVSFSEVEHNEIRRVRSELTRIGTNLNTAVKLMKSNPYGENPITIDELQVLKKILDDERQTLKDMLERNLKTWANIYPVSGK